MKLFDKGLGHQVDQAMLLQMESVLDLLNGPAPSSLSDSNSGSCNTSLDDWSDGSDDEMVDCEVSEKMMVALEWFKDAFKIVK